MTLVLVVRVASPWLCIAPLFRLAIGSSIGSYRVDSNPNQEAQTAILQRDTITTNSNISSYPYSQDTKSFKHNVCMEGKTSSSSLRVTANSTPIPFLVIESSSILLIFQWRESWNEPPFLSLTTTILHQLMVCFHPLLHGLLLDQPYLKIEKELIALLCSH